MRVEIIISIGVVNDDQFSLIRLEHRLELFENRLESIFISHRCCLHAAYCFLPTAFCLLPSAYCLLPLLVPTHSLAQRRDMCNVMPAMPGIKRYVLVETYKALFRMLKCAIEIFVFERAQKPNPTLVQSLKQIQRRFNRRNNSVRQLRPTIF